MTPVRRARSASARANSLVFLLIATSNLTKGCHRGGARSSSKGTNHDDHLPKACPLVRDLRHRHRQGRRPLRGHARRQARAQRVRAVSRTRCSPPPTGSRVSGASIVGCRRGRPGAPMRHGAVPARRPMACSVASRARSRPARSSSSRRPSIGPHGTIALVEDLRWQRSSASTPGSAVVTRLSGIYLVLNGLTESAPSRPDPVG